MVSAFYDGDGGHQGELGVPLEVWDVGHAYVAHGGADLVEGGFHVVVEGAGVGDVGVHALFKAQLGGAVHLAMGLPCGFTFCLPQGNLLLGTLFAPHPLQAGERLWDKYLLCNFFFGYQLISIKFHNKQFYPHHLFPMFHLQALGYFPIQKFQRKHTLFLQLQAIVFCISEQISSFLYKLRCRILYTHPFVIGSIQYAHK